MIPISARLRGKVKGIIFFGAGIVILGIFGGQMAFLSQPDFRVAAHLQQMMPLLTGSMALFSLSLTLLWIAVKYLPLDVLSARALIFAVLVVFLGTSLTAILTHPTHSQDIYHDLLLAKAFSRYGYNPYEAVPAYFETDPWARPIRVWKDFPMVYGPLWTLLLSGIAALGLSLAFTLITVKAVLFLTLTGATWLFWKIMAYHGLSLPARIAPLMMVLWNPFVIQTVFVDAHADVLVLLSIVASYFFLQRERYIESSLALFTGALVKYVPLLLLPVPLFYLLKARKTKSDKLFSLILVGVIGAGLGVLSYIPFGGISPERMAGLKLQLTTVGVLPLALPGTAFLWWLFDLDIISLNLFGVLGGVCALGFSLWRGKPLESYSVPYLVYFIFGTPWFQPWYMLWTFPLLLLLWPVGMTAAVSIALMLMHEVIPPLLSGGVLLVAAAAYLLVHSEFIFPLKRFTIGGHSHRTGG